ncbi:MAG: sodium-dependent bicarbonate transport family permease [Xanthobacteraceae bacterium]|nr:sodium-dependent bicarbonate transport family permease [Xanthobacteraceae bacterium]
MSFFEPAIQNLLSPAILFFSLGLIATLMRSDLAVPEAVAKFLALYLLFSIGFRGGTEIAHHGVDGRMLLTLATGAALSFMTPFAAFALLKLLSRFRPVDAAAVSAHYGSISIVTFIAATSALGRQSIPYEGFMVGVAAAMETPAILAALLIAQRGPTDTVPKPSEIWRHSFLNGSVVILIGALLIGVITGQRGATALKPFVLDLFPGLLCLFLLDIGILVGRGLEQGRKYLTPSAGLFAIMMPLSGATVAAALSYAIGLSAGGIALFMTLAASASYIAVPAALRLALPQANPSIGLTLSLGVTFPFNLVIGIPLYIWVATRFLQ